MDEPPASNDTADIWTFFIALAVAIAAYVGASFAAANSTSQLDIVLMGLGGVALLVVFYAMRNLIRRTNKETQDYFKTQRRFPPDKR